jgi:hypothetical protein
MPARSSCDGESRSAPDAQHIIVNPEIALAAALSAQASAESPRRLTPNTSASVATELSTPNGEVSSSR